MLVEVMIENPSPKMKFIVKIKVLTVVLIIISILQKEFDGLFQYHQQEHHIFGGFDFDSMCEQRKPNGNDGERRRAQCCGDFPKRKPFMANGNKDKVCCESLGLQATFNFLILIQNLTDTGENVQKWTRVFSTRS